MAIIQASYSDHRLLEPFLLHTVQVVQLPALSPRPARRFSPSSFAVKRNHPLHIALRSSPLFLTPNTPPPPPPPPRNSSRKTLTLSHSFLDDGASGSVMKVVEVDPLLAVKKKAADISPELRGTSIYLVGINSTMKTRLGKLLADSLRYYFFDSDSLVEEAAGGDSAAKSFRGRDEKGFHESETEVLKQLSSMGRLVVSAGDGAVQSATNLALLRHGISIWIDVPLDMVAREVVEDGSQLPASKISTSRSHSQVLTQLTALYEEMQGGYATADATLSLQRVACQLGFDDLDAVTTEDMVLEVFKEIAKLMRAKKMMEEAARAF